MELGRGSGAETSRDLLESSCLRNWALGIWILPLISSFLGMIQTAPRHESARSGTGTPRPPVSPPSGRPSRFKAWGNVLIQVLGWKMGALSGPGTPGFLLDHLSQGHC